MAEQDVSQVMLAVGDLYATVWHGGCEFERDAGFSRLMKMLMDMHMLDGALLVCGLRMIHVT